MIRTATRYHDFCYGHRVHGHESKCAHLHGHNGRVTFTVAANELDDLGRVIDFGEIGRILCDWVEKTWDHKFIIWERDPLHAELAKIDNTVWWSPFNPTAENFAEYLVTVVGPERLPRHVTLVEVKFEETRKCSATFSLDNWNTIDHKTPKWRGKCTEITSSGT